MTELYIGTSGYSYPYWKGRFYPDGIAASQQLTYYSSRFNTVELNYSFYRFPTVRSLLKSASVVPNDFLFSLKANKVITHSLRMKNVKEKITAFMDIALEGLGDKLACVLYQLPPSYSFSDERLNDILTNLGHQEQNVVEFRHRSWWRADVFKALSDAGLTFCSVSFPDLPEDDVCTSGIFYKRMHGVPELFKSLYDDSVIERLAAAVKQHQRAFVYFNNTMFDAGYTNALQLSGQSTGER